MVPVIPGALGRWISGVLIVVLIGVAGWWYLRARVANAAERSLQARIEQLKLNAERLADRAAKCQRNVETLRHSIATLESYIAEQNAALERLGAAYAKAEAHRRTAEARLREYLARPPTPVVVGPGTCEDMVEQARRIGGGA